MGTDHTSLQAEPCVSQSTARRQWIPLVLVLLLTVVAAVVRFAYLDAKGLWIDEHYTLELSAGRGMPHRMLPANVVYETPPDLTSLRTDAPWYAVWTNMSADVHPPLYYQLLRLWRGVFGSSDWAIRAMSVVLSTLAIPLIYLLGRRLIGTTAGLYAAAIMTVAPPQVFYAQQARMYPLAVSLSLLAMFAVVRLVQDGPTVWRCLGVVFATVAMLLSHYFTLGILGAIGLYGLIAAGDRRCRTLAVSSVLGGALLFALVWAPSLLEQLRVNAGSDAWLLEYRPVGRALRVFVNFFASTMELIARPYGRDVMSIGEMPLAIASAVVLVLAVAILPALMLRRRPGLLLPWLAYVLSALMPLTMDLVRNTRALEYNRYSLIAAAPMYLLLAGISLPGQAWIARLTRHALPIVAVAFALLSFDQSYESIWADPRVLAGPIMEGGRPGQLVVYHGIPTDAEPAWARPGDLFLYVHRYVPPGHPVMFLDREPTPELHERLRSEPDFWVVMEMVRRSWKYPQYTFEDRSAGYSYEYPMGGTYFARRKADAPASTQAHQREADHATP